MRYRSAFEARIVSIWYRSRRLKVRVLSGDLLGDTATGRGEDRREEVTTYELLGGR